MKVTVASQVSEHSTVLKWAPGQLEPVTSPCSGKTIWPEPTISLGMVKAPSKMPIPTSSPPDVNGTCQPFIAFSAQPEISTVNESMTRAAKVVNPAALLVASSPPALESTMVVVAAVRPSPTHRG